MLKWMTMPKALSLCIQVTQFLGTLEILSSESMAERMAFGAKDVDLESETPLCFWFRES
jgi:hypothetical protein